jgi:hypothetical protein
MKKQQLFLSLFAKLFSLLIILVFELSFVPGASAVPLSSGGGFSWGGHHHFIDVSCDWPLGGGDWTTDLAARTVTQSVASMPCSGTNLDPDGNGTVDNPCVPGVSCPVPAGSGNFSLTLTFTIPQNATNQLSGISCQNDVRTYKAYCEQAMFANPDSVQGTFTLLGSIVPPFVQILGCTATPCTWDLGSLPSKSQGTRLVLDTSQTGCQLAFPAEDITLPNIPVVHLETNQLLLYKEQFTNGNGQCTAGTVAPVTHGARACIGEANVLAVTDCNQIGSGSNTSYHVAFQENNNYLFNVSHLETRDKIQDNSSCTNSGTVKFTVYGQPEFDVRSIAGLFPFNANLAPTLTVIGTTINPTPATKAQTIGQLIDQNGDGFLDVDIFYSGCGLGAQIANDPDFHTGDNVTIEMDGRTVGGSQGSSIPFTATTSAGTN